MKINSIRQLDREIIGCTKCPRLVKYTKKIAREKVKRFRTEEYWGRPIPGFGDTTAEILLIGLAPAAHGGNRTGRMFTGDSSGDWVARALYENGLASRATSTSRSDGFEPQNVYITAAVRCAPPQNKPLGEEFANCLCYLERELALLPNIRIIICLGRKAFDACRKLLQMPRAEFAHGRLIPFQRWMIICSYHPSRQNTQTGRLTWNQWDGIFKKARMLLQSGPKGRPKGGRLKNY